MKFFTSVRVKIFQGFLFLSFLGVIGVNVLVYVVLKKSSERHNERELRYTIEVLMSSLDYAISYTNVTEENIASVLGKKILEIADVSKKDIVVYDMKGDYLFSNRQIDSNMVQQRVPHVVLREILGGKNRYDVHYYDGENGANITSSYFLLLNNMLEPIAIVYLPFYYNDGIYVDGLRKHIFMVMISSSLLVILGIVISWYISQYLTKNIRNISNQMLGINLNEEFMPIVYHTEDELLPLVNSYNKSLRMIEEQKQLLSYKEKESAWREMAKQVAHEVKNPLTPMKLLIQNFERKFDKNAPDIEERVKKLSYTITKQIDLMVNVANAFSEFTRLPERVDEIINVNQEMESVIRVFEEKEEIKLNAPQEEMLIRFDRTYFQRIMSNVILNAQQAKSDDRPLEIRVSIEQINKKLKIEVVDNSVGIPRERLKRIFEPNFTTKNSGTGLGLTMVKRMIEDYKGEITITSEEGKGTKVVIIIPKNNL